jgi:hypothetical protein
MKRLISILLLLIIIFSLASCAKCVRTEISEVEVELVEAYFKKGSTYFIPMKVGKITTMSPRKHPDQYIVKVRYNGNLYTYNDYEFFKAHEYDEYGSTIIMLWVIREFDDGSFKANLKIDSSQY